MKKIIVSIFALLLCVNVNFGQEDVSKKVLNWYNGSKYGMSTDKAYKKLLAGKKSTTVVVAVIDSGVDIEHEDLKGKIWVNTNEIADNGIDDDKNGYIDDIHGWNFLGNPDGENINDVQLEVTRIYARLNEKYKGKSYTELNDEEKKEYDYYKELREEVQKNRKNLEKTLTFYNEIQTKLSESDTRLKKSFGGDYTGKDVKKLSKDESSKLNKDAVMMYNFKKNGGSFEGLEGAIKDLSGRLNGWYNPDLDVRKIVGDDASDFSDTNYGNNNVEGPDPFHGTHCSGIISANRGNGIGNDGVADNVLIMSLRVVPNGDERDKDVALSIRYAVDNGAQIINMSFGKGYSPYEDEVIASIRYAEEKGVLLVHAAGNSNEDIGKNDNFPTPKYSSMTVKFTNWIEVGASTQNKKELAAYFSNYSDELVDIFAPGLDIYSTVPQSDYGIAKGTSMAAPMVAGVAALLKSYFPELTMIQIKEIILTSGQDVGEKTTSLPGVPDSDRAQVPFKALCASASIVNTFNAVEKAIEMSN